MENTLTRQNCTIHYWLTDSENAPLVVFTHGATIDHHEWDATIPLVAEHFRVLTWDIRGHGLSRPGVFDVGEARRDLVALLDHLKVEQAIFVGHSMGGNLHQEVVFHHPERVKALAMLGCTWNFVKLSTADSFLLRFAKPIFALYSPKALIDQSLAVSATSKESQALMRRPMELLTKDEFIHILLTAAADCLHYEPTYHIPVPLLLMMGDQEATGNIRTAMPAWARHEGRELVVIPNAKHAANLDNPAFFHRKLLEFLKQQS